jgi:hypothetical protein
MSTINGLPAHALLVHFIVVLAPLTAVLAMVSAVGTATIGVAGVRARGRDVDLDAGHDSGR